MDKLKMIGGAVAGALVIAAGVAGGRSLLADAPAEVRATVATASVREEAAKYDTDQDALDGLRATVAGADCAALEDACRAAVGAAASSCEAYEAALQAGTVAAARSALRACGTAENTRATACPASVACADSRRLAREVFELKAGGR